ncbi:MAG: dihydropteroate synthase [Anaerolineae bacterium]|nr:dihydropteroate synthase [Anaerolineae bacterium]
MPTLTSRNGSLTYGAGYPTLLINDQPRIMDQDPRVKDELMAGRVDLLVEIARRGAALGADMAAVLVTDVDVDEVEMLPRAAVAIHNALGCPIGLDTRNPEALAAALEAMRPYRCFVSSVSGEPGVMEAMLPVVKRYNAVVAGMPMGRYSHLVPMSVEGRLAEARYILEVCAGYGIRREDVVMDGICMAASTLVAGAFRITLETLAAFHSQLGCATLLGIGNAGHGMPDPTRIDLAFLLGAMPWGLDSALVDPRTVALLESVRGMDFLTERDPTGKRYLQHWRAKNGKIRV